ncbi:MAG: hypothetical protein R3C05_05310 [Pirellulaceae bacterium]
MATIAGPAGPLAGTATGRIRLAAVVSIQAIGATNFDTPAPVSFPNVSNLPPARRHFFDHLIMTLAYGMSSAPPPFHPTATLSSPIPVRVIAPGSA